MGKLMFQQIGYFLVGCVLIGYCAVPVLATGTEYMTVFRFVSTVGFVASGWAVIPLSNWFGHLWFMTAKYLLNALIYALVIAGAFAWLWPAGGLIPAQGSVCGQKGIATDMAIRSMYLSYLT